MSCCFSTLLQFTCTKPSPGRATSKTAQYPSQKRHTRLRRAKKRSQDQLATKDHEGVQLTTHDHAWGPTHRAIKDYDGHVYPRHVLEVLPSRQVDDADSARRGVYQAHLGHDEDGDGGTNAQGDPLGSRGRQGARGERCQRYVVGLAATGSPAVTYSRNMHVQATPRTINEPRVQHPGADALHRPSTAMEPQQQGKAELTRGMYSPTVTI